MYEAITYEKIFSTIKDKGVVESIIGLLLARPGTVTGNEIIKSLPYYHHRSGSNCNFFLAGYGAYWYGEYPDETNVVKIDNEEWSYSNKMFAKFIDSIESNSTWRFSGESELILIHVINERLDFSKTIVFNMDRLIKDEVVTSINAFLEVIFRELSKYGINEISDIGICRAILDSILKQIKDSCPTFINKMWTQGKHYAVHNYTKK